MSAVELYFGELVGRIRALTDGELVGVYAGGSYALRAYEPGRSDLDVAVVVSAPPSRAVKEKMVAAIRHEALPCPARGLELVLYRFAVVRELTVEAGFDLNLNTGAAMPFRAEFEPNGREAHWFPIDRSILRQCGVVLSGPSPADVFASLPRRLILPLLLDSLRWHAREPARSDDAVLNACRSWRYAVESIWSSKPAAGAWALARPDAPQIVAEALRARHGSARLDPAAVDSFLRTVTRKIESVAEELTRSRPS